MRRTLYAKNCPGGMNSGGTIEMLKHGNDALRERPRRQGAARERRED